MMVTRNPTDRPASTEGEKEKAAALKAAALRLNLLRSFDLCDGLPFGYAQDKRAFGFAQDGLRPARLWRAVSG